MFANVKAHIALYEYAGRHTCRKIGQSYRRFVLG